MAATADLAMANSGSDDALLEHDAGLPSASQVWGQAPSSSHDDTCSATQPMCPPSPLDYSTVDTSSEADVKYCFAHWQAYKPKPQTAADWITLKEVVDTYWLTKLRTLESEHGTHTDEDMEYMIAKIKVAWLTSSTEVQEEQNKQCTFGQPLSESDSDYEVILAACEMMLTAEREAAQAHPY